jgi:hypothetical protein
MWERVRLLLVCGLSCVASACEGSAEQQATIDPHTPSAFAIPRLIVASIEPYSSAEAALADQGNIDWVLDEGRAAAITAAYTAQELQRHLAQVGIDARIATAAPPEQSAIVLAVGETVLAMPDGRLVDRDALGEQEYAIFPRGNRIYVAAPTRIGVLNGAYRLLEYLGFAWDDPYETHTPERLGSASRLAWPIIREKPRVALRGFSIYGEQTLTDEFAVWMARNRLNIGGNARVPLGRLLGLKRWEGEHEFIQQEFSQPGLFEAHPEWYALIDGRRHPIPSTGPYVNPAFGNPGAAEYFAQRMLERLQVGDLREVDVLNIWPADNRGNVFDQSPEARALGNETDNLLHFYAVLCRTLRAAQLTGRLSRSVTVAGISYYLSRHSRNQTGRSTVRTS